MTPSPQKLRATVPESIVAFLGLNRGDTMNWKMDFKNQERFAVVTKSKAAEDAESKEEGKAASEPDPADRRRRLYSPREAPR